MQRCTLKTLDAGVPCRTLTTTWPWKREAKIFEDRGCCHYPLRGEEPRPVAPRIVEHLYGGRDGVIRAVKLRTSKSIPERPIQHLYPLELFCDDPENVARPTQLHAQTPVFRPRRDAALAARIRDSHRTHLNCGNY